MTAARRQLSPVQIGRILKINSLSVTTDEEIEVVRGTLVIGAA